MSQRGQPRWPVVVLIENGSTDVLAELPPDATWLRDGLPGAPFDLSERRLVREVTVTDGAGSADVIAAAARGVSSVCLVEIADQEVADLVDELGRVADVRDRRQQALPAGGLSDEHARLLKALRSGSSLTEAARALGWSRRTATRRLAEARDALGAVTTAEALTRSM
jgi:hypothetical protein